MSVFIPSTSGVGFTTAYTPSATQNLTYMCWVMLGTTNPGTWRGFITGEPNLYLQTQADGLTLTMGTTSAYHGALVASPNVWYHVAGTCTNSSTTARTISTYVNGYAIITNSADTATFSTYTSHALGVDPAPNATLRDVRIWNRPLTAREIADEYASGVPVHRQGLTIWSPLDDNLFVDKSGNGHIWTASGTGQLLQAGPLRPWSGRGSEYFR
jgi:hypothetical protein